jgi:molecular chaperone Hsp33
MTDADPREPEPGAPRPAGDDTILPFQLDRANIRGRVARLDDTLERILSQHRYPPAVSALVAEAVLLTALIGQTIKLRWRLSLQVRGEGAVRLIATDYFGPEADGRPAWIRAYAGFDRGDAVSTRGTPFDLLGKGVFGLTIDQGPQMAPYQGITPLTGGSLAACAETYFAQSEQLATRFTISAAHAQAPGEAPRWRGAGLMLQQLPQAAPGAERGAPSGEDGLMTGDDVAAMGDEEDAWTRVTLLAGTVEEHELLGPRPGPEGLLWRLFNEEVPRVYDAQPVEFGCTCSAARVRQALAQYSAKDIASMTTEDGRVTADCQFCSAHYEFDPSTLGFEASSQP